MAKKSDPLKALGQMNAGIAPTPPPVEEVTHTPPAQIGIVQPKYTDWNPVDEPEYTSSGRELYYAREKFILAHSEKGSGKTRAAIEKLVDHCFTYDNALGIIQVRVRNQATKGGAWSELQYVLSRWRKKKGIEHSRVMLDSQKNEIIWIKTKNYKWSLFALISAPHASVLEKTAPGYVPSMVVADELTDCDDEVYFKAMAAQVGRRRGIPGEAQQFIGCCNPKGPSHWVYKKWFEEPFDELTGEKDEDFRDIKFSVEENLKNLPAGYLESLRKIYRNSPIEAKRLIEGDWIDKASADSLFGDIYSPASHVRPLTEDGLPHPKKRIMPSRKSSIIIGIDSGSTYHSFSFMQWLPVDGRMKWVIFDEVVVLKKKLSYMKLIPIVMRRLKWWLDLDPVKPQFIAISDESAFNQFRPGTGSFDVAEMQKAWAAYEKLMCEQTGQTVWLGPIRIRGCPKFDGSVAARIRTLQEALGNELLVSASCVYTQKMLLMLESKKQPKDGPYNDDLSMSPQRSDHLHVFDSVTYVMLMGRLHPARLIPPTASTGSMLIDIHAA